MMDNPEKFAAQLDAENYSAPTSPVPDPQDSDDPIDFLIDRVRLVVHESAQMGTEPLSTIASVLAQLYQAKALRDIAEQMEEINGPRRNPRLRTSRHFARRRPRRSFADIFRDMADAFEDSFEDR